METDDLFAIRCGADASNGHREMLISSLDIGIIMEVEFTFEDVKDVME